MTDPSSSEPVGVYLAPLAVIPNWVFRRLDDQPAEVFKFYAWLHFSVLGEDNRGYKKLAEIAAARGVSERTVKRWVAALVDAGVVRVERFRRRNGKLGQNVYYCPRDEPGGPLDPAEAATGHRVAPGSEQGERPTRGHGVAPGPEQGNGTTRGHGVAPDQGSPGGPSINPDTNSLTQTAEPLRGSPAALRAAEQPALIPDEILEAQPANLPAVRQEAEVVTFNAGTLTREMVDVLRARDIRIHEREIKRFAKEFKEAIDQGFTEPVIRQALNLMFRDRVMAHPAYFSKYLLRAQMGAELPPERLSRAQADRLRQQGETPDDTAASVAAFLSIPDPRKAATP